MPSTNSEETKLCQDCGEPMVKCDDCKGWVKPCFLRMGMIHVCDTRPTDSGTFFTKSQTNRKQ